MPLAPGVLSGCWDESIKLFHQEISAVVLVAWKDPTEHQIYRLCMFKCKPGVVIAIFRQIKQIFN